MSDGVHKTIDNNSENEDYFYNTFDNLKEILKIENEIKENDIYNLLNFNIFNEKLLTLIKRKYDSISFDYFKKYYPINSKWIENYLKFYNYNKISSLIKRQSNGEIKIRDLQRTILQKRIMKLPGEENENKNKLLWIDFNPKSEQIPRNIYYDEIEETIEFFNDFIIVNEELYNEIRKNDDEGYNFNYKNTIDICLVDNLFIYKITENILGFGILPELTNNNNLNIFKIQFLIILDEFNIDSEMKELFKHKDLINYLISRDVQIQDNNNKRINIYDGETKIGFFYNFGNFEIQNYRTRTKEGIIEMINQAEIEKDINKKEDEEKKKLEEMTNQIEIKEDINKKEDEEGKKLEEMTYQIEIKEDINKKENEKKRRLIREKELKEEEKRKEIEIQKQLKKENERKKELEMQQKILGVINFEIERERDKEQLKKLLEREKQKKQVEKIEKFNNTNIDYISNNNILVKKIENGNNDIIEEKIELEDEQKKPNIINGMNNLKISVDDIKTHTNIKFNKILLFPKKENENAKTKTSFYHHTLSNNVSLPKIKPKNLNIQTESSLGSNKKNTRPMSLRKTEYKLTQYSTNVSNNIMYKTLNNDKPNIANNIISNYNNDNAFGIPFYNNLNTQGLQELNLIIPEKQKLIKSQEFDQNLNIKGKLTFFGKQNDEENIIVKPIQENKEKQDKQNGKKELSKYFLNDPNKNNVNNNNKNNNNLIKNCNDTKNFEKTMYKIKKGKKTESPKKENKRYDDNNEKNKIEIKKSNNNNKHTNNKVKGHFNCKLKTNLPKIQGRNQQQLENKKKKLEINLQKYYEEQAKKKEEEEKKRKIKEQHGEEIRKRKEEKDRQDRDKLRAKFEMKEEYNKIKREIREQGKHI